MKKLAIMVSLIGVLSGTNSIAQPTVTVTALTNGVPSEASYGMIWMTVNGTNRFTRTGSTDEALRIYYSLSGTASPGHFIPETGEFYQYDADGYCLNEADYLPLPSTYETHIGPDCKYAFDRWYIDIPEGETNADLIINPQVDFYCESNETVNLMILADSSYIVGSSSNTSMVIADAPSEELFSEFLQSTSLEGTTNILRIRRSCSMPTNELASSTFFLGNTSSANYGEDFTISGITYNPDYSSFEVTIPANQEFVDLTVNVLSDTNEECNEVVLINPLTRSCIVHQPPFSAKLTIKDVLLPVYTNAAVGFDTNDDFYFTISKSAGAPSNAVVYTTTDFNSWTSNNTVTFSGNSATFTDVGSHSFSAMFYRVRNGSNDSVAPVGYYKATAQPSFTMLANQLMRGSNSLAEVLLDAPPESMVYKYSSGVIPSSVDVFNGDTNLAPVGWYVSDTGDPSTTTINPGEGFFFYNPRMTNITLKFVGTVLTGTLTNTIPAGLSAVSSIVPQAGDSCFLGVTQFSLFDEILKFNSNDFDIYTWTLGGWYPNIPSFGLGEGFFIDVASPFVWTREFRPLDCP